MKKIENCSEHCDYGCGKMAQFVTKGGKFCCSDSTNKCFAVRTKNTNSQRISYKTGDRVPPMSLCEPWNKGLNKIADVRIAKYASSISNTLTGRPGKPHTSESKAKLSAAAKRNEFGGHTSKQKLHFKKNDGTTVYLQSSYEIKLASIFEELQICWERPTPLKWIDDDGVEHRYYPDFKVGDKYFDTKNDYLAKVDARKIELVCEQNNVDLTILLLPQITNEYIATLV